MKSNGESSSSEARKDSELPENIEKDELIFVPKNVNSYDEVSFDNLDRVSSMDVKDSNVLGVGSDVKHENQNQQSSRITEDPYPYPFNRDQPNRSPVKVHKLVLQSITYMRKLDGCTANDIKQYLYQNSDISIKYLDGEINQFLSYGSENGVLTCVDGKYFIPEERPRKVRSIFSTIASAQRNIKRNKITVDMLAETFKKSAKVAAKSSTSDAEKANKKNKKRSAERDMPCLSTLQQPPMSIPEVPTFPFDPFKIVTRSMTKVMLNSNEIPGCQK